MVGGRAATGHGRHVGVARLAGFLVGGGIAAFVADAAFHTLHQVGGSGRRSGVKPETDSEAGNKM